MLAASWSEMPLGQAITLQRGFDLPHRNRRPGSTPIVSSSGISGFHDEAPVRKPGVVTGRYGTIGEVFFLEEDFWPLNTTLYVRDFKGNEPLYISYLLRTIDFQSHSGKSGVPGVNRNDLHGLDIKLPPPPEQRAIAAGLSDMDALISGLDQLIAKKRDLKQAAMQQLLTGQRRLPGFSGVWEVKRFGDLFKFLKTANSSRADLSLLGDIEYIHYGDIHTTASAFLDCSSSALPRIQKEKVEGIPFVEDGDLVMADASEDYDGIGKSMEVRGVGGRNVVAGLHTFLLRGDREALADGFKGYLQFNPAVRTALIQLATGISVYGVSKSNVRSIELTLPKPEEQSAIATVLSDMDAEITALESRRDKTRDLKQGMMQELLTGRIRLV